MDSQLSLSWWTESPLQTLLCVDTEAGSGSRSRKWRLQAHLGVMLLVLLQDVQAELSQPQQLLQSSL